MCYSELVGLQFCTSSNNDAVRVLMDNKHLLVRHFRALPSPAEFAKIEDANVPAVFEGCVRSWPAYNLWDPSKGGLQRLKHLAGPAIVQVMATTSGSNFYGDIRGHERVPIQFQSFLDLADRSTKIAEVRSTESTEKQEEFAFLESQDVQLYLAQAGIYSQESTATSAPLSSLREDIDTPSFLQSPMSAMNLWMSINGSRSSTHYDPYHNLLCILSGCKEVKLWPPSAAPSLYPLPIFGEASNHSGVDFAKPDLTKHPRFHSAMQSYQSVTLHAGDSLFLPEGWYHQVDSEAVTIAVNLWWPSKISLKLGSHMDAYLLRRLLANLLDSEKEQIIKDFGRSISGDATVEEAHSNSSELPVDVQKTTDLGESVTGVREKCVPVNGEEGKSRGYVDRGANANEQADGQESCRESAEMENLIRSKQKSKSDRRKSKRVMKAVRDSSSSGMDCRVLGADLSSPSMQSESAVEDVGGDSKASTGKTLFHQKNCPMNLTDVDIQALRTLILCVSDMMSTSDAVTGANEYARARSHESGDSIARVFLSLDPPSLQRTLLVMSVDYPRTFEALILQKLSPLASEILTRKFEEMDAEPKLDCPQEEFYSRIYSVFDDPGLAMASLVDGKESFAAMALKCVLNGNLGLQVHAGPEV